MLFILGGAFNYFLIIKKISVAHILWVEAIYRKLADYYRLSEYAITTFEPSSLHTASARRAATCTPSRHRSLFIQIIRFLLWLHFYKFAHERLINIHHGAIVIEVTHVSWCAEYCYQSTVCEKFVAVLDYLMCSRYQIYI